MKRFLMIFAAAAALCACQPKAKLVIIHTNDTHSHLEPMRTGNYVGHGGVIERAAFIDSVRNKRGEDKVLLVHAGDFVQGTSYYTVLEGEIEINLINDLRYDVITLGNHEFDNGLEALAGMMKRLETAKVVCSNLDLIPFEVGEYVKPYAVVERGGLRIGFVGLASDLLHNVSRTISSRIQQLDDVESVNRWTAYLREEEKVDMVILLSHAGYDNDQKIIPSTHGVDLVIGGHSHTYVDDFIYVEDADNKKVPITQDGGWGLELGEIEVR